MEPTINPGDLRYRVVLQRPSIASVSGAEQREYVDTATVAAKIDFGTGRFFMAAKAVDTELTHMVTIYRYLGLDSTWRIRFDDPLGGSSQILQIRGVEELGLMRRYTRLQCVAHG